MANVINRVEDFITDGLGYIFKQEIILSQDEINSINSEIRKHKKLNPNDKNLSQIFFYPNDDSDEENEDDFSDMCFLNITTTSFIKKTLNLELDDLNTYISLKN